MARLFEGWQAGSAVVVVAVLVTLIAVPRPVTPDEVPLPLPNRSVLRGISLRERALAAEVAAKPLPFDVRSLGEAFRSYGVAEAAGDANAVARTTAVLQQRRPAALAYGDDLLRLRAYQMTVFLRALAAFETTGIESLELQEIGGGAVRAAREAGWLVRTGHGFRFLADRTTREVLFRKRWNEVTGLKAGPFALTLDEHRALYAFLIRHPIGRLPNPTWDDPAARCRAADVFLLRKVTELGEMDPTYPTSYARGILLLRMDRPQQAIIPLADFVDQHPNGPFVLRARNALREAQQRLSDLNEQ